MEPLYPYVTECCTECGEKLKEWEQIVYVHICNQCGRINKRSA